MKAVKLNRVYTITEAEAKGYQKQGYDIIDDDGTVKAYGFGKTISYEKYMKLLASYEDLCTKFEALEKQVADLKKPKKPVKKTEEKKDAPVE